MSGLTVAERPPVSPSARGYHAVYRENEVNYCPGCGRTHWLIGRLSAECAFCATALPLDADITTQPPRLWQRGSGGGKVTQQGRDRPAPTNRRSYR